MRPAPGPPHTKRMATRRAAAPARSRSRSSGGAARSARGRSARSAAGVRKYGLPLTSSWRTANYAYPGGVGASRGKAPSYPINPGRVRAALSYSARPDTAGSGRHVRWAIAQRYGSVGGGLAAARRTRRGR